MKQLIDYIESSPPGKRDKVSRTLNKMNTSTTKVIEENYRRLSQPTGLTNFFVNHPYIWLYIAFLIFGSLSFVVFYLNWFKVNEVNAREYLVWDDIKT